MVQRCPPGERALHEPLRPAQPPQAQPAPEDLARRAEPDDGTIGPSEWRELLTGETDRRVRIVLDDEHTVLVGQLDLDGSPARPAA